MHSFCFTHLAIEGCWFSGFNVSSECEFSWRVTHSFPEQLFVLSLELSWCCPHFNPALADAGKGMGLGHLRAVSAWKHGALFHPCPAGSRHLPLPPEGLLDLTPRVLAKTSKSSWV